MPGEVGVAGELERAWPESAIPWVRASLRPGSFECSQRAVRPEPGGCLVVSPRESSQIQIGRSWAEVKKLKNRVP